MSAYANVLLKTLLRAVYVIPLAYMLGFVLTTALPELGASVLGVNAANPHVIQQFQRAADVPTNTMDALARLASGKLGNTLDRRPVATELLHAIRMAGPLFLAVTVLICFSAIIGSVLGLREQRAGGWLFSLLAFLPAYVPAFLLVGLYPLFGHEPTAAAGGTLLLAAGTIALIPGAVIAATAQAAVRSARDSTYFFTLQAHGYSHITCMRLLAPMVIKQLLVVLPRVLISALMVQVFAEAVFGFSGIGSSLLQALRRSDVNLLLGYILLISTFSMVLAALIQTVSLVLLGRAQHE